MKKTFFDKRFFSLKSRHVHQTLLQKIQRKKFAYWALVESYRTERGPRQRIVAYLVVSKDGIPLGSIFFALYKSQAVLTPLTNLLFSAFRIGAGIMSSLGPVLMGLLSPFGAVAIAIGGVVAAILYFAGAGSKLLGWVGGLCTKLKDWFTATFSLPAFKSCGSMPEIEDTSKAAVRDAKAMESYWACETS